MRGSYLSFSVPLHSLSAISKAVAFAVAIYLLLPALVLRADTFGSGENSFDIDFVTIGDPGNLPDTTGNPNPAGAVPYTYRMSKYEISRDMVDKANALGGLGITLTEFGDDNDGPDKPAAGTTRQKRSASPSPNPYGSKAEAPNSNRRRSILSNGSLTSGKTIDGFATRQQAAITGHCNHSKCLEHT